MKTKQKSGGEMTSAQHKVKRTDDNCGEWVECMGVVSRKWVWLVGVVSRMWVESMGVVSGCGCKEVY